jgi:hypothetical protein
MLNLRSDRRAAAPPAYAIGRKDPRAASMRGREWRLLVMLAVGIGVMAWLAWSLVEDYRVGMAGLAQGPVTLAPGPQAMPAPTLEGADPLPTAAQIADQASVIAALAPEQLGTVAGLDTDAATLAWILPVLAADRTAPPLPSRPDPADLARRDLPLGAPLTIAGHLIDARLAEIGGGDPRWRLLVATAADQYALVLLDAPSCAVDAGTPIQVTGRFAGVAGLPAEAGGPPVRLPLIAARVAAPAAAQEDSLAAYRRAFSGMPPGVLTDIDDERTTVETPAYYHLLGQIVADRAFTDPYADALSANLRGNDLHQDPAAHRGDPAQVHLHVFDAWEDAVVARDQPFGVARVVRILGYKRDWSPITLAGPDGNPVTRHQMVMRLFEIAAVTAAPLPAPGAEITTTGRFLKIRAIPVVPDLDRDRRLGITRQRADRVYAFFVVTNGWQDVRQNTGPSFTGPAIGLLAAALALVGLLIWQGRGEAAASDRVPARLRRLRDQRRRPAASAEQPAQVDDAVRDGTAGSD